MHLSCRPGSLCGVGGRQTVTDYRFLQIYRLKKRGMDLLYKDLTEQIIGAAFHVHNAIGHGHREVVYQRALGEALRSRGLQVVEQFTVPIIFNLTKVGTALVDFCVNDCVLVEIKSLEHFRTADFRQLNGYLKWSGKQLGLLMTFGAHGVKVKRVANIDGYETFNL